MSIKLCGALRPLFGFVLIFIGAGAALGSLSTRACAQDISYFRIATASPSGTYFPVGQLLAALISQPPGAAACDDGGPCGADGIIGIAEVSDGSVANLHEVNSGRIESGLAQGDMIDWAVRAVGVFTDEQRMRGVRAIANLYPESFHLVAARGSDITGVADLAGKRVSTDRIGSGTHADAMLVLEAFGLGSEDIVAVHVPPGKAADMLIAGKLDAFFFVGGYPAEAIAGLARADAIKLISIEGPQIEALMRRNSFLSAGTIPADAYMPSLGAIPTITVGAQWIVHAGVDEDLVYRITHALWDDRNRDAWLGAHPRARQILPQTAVSGITIPLHAGALRYYREAGLLPRAGNDVQPTIGQAAPAVEAD